MLCDCSPAYAQAPLMIGPITDGRHQRSKHLASSLFLAGTDELAQISDERNLTG